MGDVYGVILRDHIKAEIERRDFIYNDEDYAVSRKMIAEINCMGYNFKYLSEIEAYQIPNVAPIIEKYIHSFKAQSTRAYLVPHLSLEKRSETILGLYLNFKDSQEYIAPAGVRAPAHIYVRYDNALQKCAPKALKNRLVELLSNPRDAFYLPFTARMLSSWKIPEFKQVLISYLNSEDLKHGDVGLKNDGLIYFPSFDYIKKDLQFTAVAGLKYYPQDDTVSLLENELKKAKAAADKDMKSAIEKSLKRVERFANKNHT